MAKLTPQEFYKTYAPYAIKCQNETGLHYLATLTQAAHESGWAEHIIGKGNLFGIKDTDGVNGNEVEVTTTEILNTDKKVFAKTISIVKYGNKFLHTIKDYFRKYDSVELGFKDHSKYFLDNGRYHKAWAYRGDAEIFIKEVARAGYATDPLYAEKLLSTLKWFQNYSRIVK